MIRTLAVVLGVAMVCGASASAQSLEVHLTRSEAGGPLRAGALYVATPIGEWLYFDVAIEPFVNGALRPHRDIYLVGPGGARISLPDLRTYRANREEIRGVFGAIATSDAAGVFPIAKQFSVNCADGPDTLLHGGASAGGGGGCRRYALWRFTAGPVDRVIPLDSAGTAVLTELLFQAPAGDWTAGDYVLAIEGPGDSVTRLPVRIG